MSPARRDPLLRVENLSHHYGGQVGLSEVSFEMHPGASLGRVGVVGGWWGEGGRRPESRDCMAMMRATACW